MNESDAGRLVFGSESQRAGGLAEVFGTVFNDFGYDPLIAYRPREIEEGRYKVVQIEHSNLSPTAEQAVIAALSKLVEEAKAQSAKKLIGFRLVEVLGRDTQELWTILRHAGIGSEQAVAAVLNGANDRTQGLEPEALSGRTPAQFLASQIFNALQTMPDVKKALLESLQLAFMQFPQSGKSDLAAARTEDPRELVAEGPKI